ncbi:unnamed protein product, partial [Iphiclides podalirius]
MYKIRLVKVPLSCERYTGALKPFQSSVYCDDALGRLIEEATCAGSGKFQENGNTGEKRGGDGQYTEARRELRNQPGLLSLVTRVVLRIGSMD